MAGERILIVDDRAEMRHTLADNILRPAGYAVLTAADPDEGLTLARDLTPDLIITAHRLPGCDGLGLLHNLRQIGLEPPLILLVAEGSEALAVAALRQGVSDYLNLPVQAEDVLAALERALRQHWHRKITEHVPSQLLAANRQLEQRLRELDTLVEVGKRVTGQLDLQEVLQQVVGAAVKLARAEEGSLLLVDQPSGELYLQVSSGDLRPAYGSLRLRMADSLAGQVVQSREPLVITGNDLQSITSRYLFRDLIYVPLELKDQVIGVLGVLNRQTSAGFAPHTLPLLSVMADFAAIAIENARLYATTEQERDTLNTILRDTEDAILVVDHASRVLFCNPAACRTLGVHPDACLGLPLAEAIPQQEIVTLFEKEARSGRTRRSEITLDDGQRIMNAQLTVVKGVGRVVVMQDITHLKELDRIKSDFVTAVSHDLRSPLTAILGYVEMVQRSGSLAEGQKIFLERIVFSVQSITSLITDLLELGKIEAGFDDDREPVYLNAIVAHVLQSTRHRWEARRQNVQVDLPAGLPPVLGHALRMRQMLTNLVENAVKYTPEEGNVRVTAETDGEFVILRVSDTGIGIPAKDQPYIFDKFFRTDEAIDHYEGTGLGLSIVKSIVEQHQGRIWLDSQVGYGTTFTVMLPIYDPDAAPANGTPVTLA